MTSLNATQKFYKDKTIFITGASGFMGKCLLEKLLYSCSEVKEILILMRPKRGKTAKERVADFANLPMFQRINQEKPEILKKITPVFGDITIVDLGLSEEQLNYVIKETHIAFHMAATLRLEATLKPSIIMNLLGTKHMIDICKRMPKVIAVLHLSTAFCICDETVSLEKVYDWHHDPKDLLKCAEWMDERTMELMQPQLLGPHPNTYTYTKRLAEIYVQGEYGNLPICIVRPSIVTPALHEPLPGWVDNLNGPIGIMVGAAKGVIRSLLCNGELAGEVIPVDFAINGLIAIAKSVGTMKEKPVEIPVYHVTCDENKKTPWKVVLEEGRRLNNDYPFEIGLWYPGGGITTNKFLHKMNVALWHWGPAYLIDGLMFIFRQKRFMRHVQTKISQGLEVLQFFTMREWSFKSDNFVDVHNKMDADEKLMFYTNTAVMEGDTIDYLKLTILGGRQYCLKEPLTTLPKARIQLKIMYCLDRFFKGLFFYYLIMWFLKLTGLDVMLYDFMDSFSSSSSLNAAKIV